MDNSERNDASEKLRIRAESFADHFSQARMFYRSQTEPEQAHIAAALVFELSKVQLVHVRTRTLAQLRNVDEELAKRVADGLAMPLPKAEKPAVAPQDMKPSDKLSLHKKFVPTLKGRKVGIVFDEGSDLAEINAVKAAIEKAGCTAMLIAPKVGGIKVKGGTLAADGQLAGTPSVLLDAIALVLTEKAAIKLCGESAAVDFVSDAFVHLKAIGHTQGAQPLLDRAGVVAGDGIIPNMVMAVLIGFAVATAYLLGYGSAHEGRSHNAATTIVFALVAIAIALIIDLDRPRLGFIKVDQDPMERVILSINPPRAAPDEP